MQVTYTFVHFVFLPIVIFLLTFVLILRILEKMKPADAIFFSVLSHKALMQPKSQF